jgi:thioredoxin 1
MSIGVLFYLAAGTGLGAVWGYFGKCRTGACPLTATPWRGAIYGGVLAFVLYFASNQGGETSAAASRNVKLIAAEQFESEVTQAGKPVVIDFFATWCGPCRRLSPMLDDLAGPLTNQVKFVKVNVDQAQELAQRWEVEGLPTLLFLNDGKVVDKVVGLPSREELRERLSALVKPAPLAASDFGGS